MLTGNKIVTEETEMPEIMEEKQQAKPNDESTTEENNSMQEMIKVLQERLTIYEIAEQKARKENESGKAKRFSRGVRTLKEMLVSLQSGRNINEADIPPLLPPSATTESTIKNTGKYIFFHVHMLGIVIYIFLSMNLSRSILFGSNSILKKIDYVLYIYNQYIGYIKSCKLPKYLEK